MPLSVLGLRERTVVSEFLVAVVTKLIGRSMALLIGALLIVQM